VEVIPQEDQNHKKSKGNEVEKMGLLESEVLFGQGQDIEIKKRSGQIRKGKTNIQDMGDMGEKVPLEVQEMSKDSAELYESKDEQKHGQNDIGRPLPVLPGKKIGQKEKTLENDEDMKEVFKVMEQVHPTSPAPDFKISNPRQIMQAS